MNIVSKVMEKSWKFVGKNVYEPWLEKNHIQKEGAWRCNPSDDRSRRKGVGWLSFNLIFTMFL